MSVLAYELLFRDGDVDHATVRDETSATAQVVVNALMDIGMDEMVGKHLAFINFGRKLLMNNHCESLPHDRVVLEVLETVEPDPSLMKRLEQLRTKRYRIALDDFVCSEPYLPLLELADFVKLDVLSADWPEIERAVALLNKYPVQIVAEKVETREHVERCKAMGFHHFQGYFFCRPQNLLGKRLPANRLTTLRVLAQLNSPRISMTELEETIGQDLALSYRLLRYINSAMVGLNVQVQSIRHATVMVGFDKMRAWASLIGLSMFDDTPNDVIVAGSLRARMCELLAMELRLPHPERHFLVGLFSVLDAILNESMQHVVSALSLSDDLNEALLNHDGELGSTLRCVQAYERREWDRAQSSVGLEAGVIERIYLEAFAWFSKMASA
jgi:EAL and modified HD-GYP domain-containing signal transduction protein